MKGAAEAMPPGPGGAGIAWWLGEWALDKLRGLSPLLPQQYLELAVES